MDTAPVWIDTEGTYVVWSFPTEGLPGIAYRGSLHWVVVTQHVVPKTWWTDNELASEWRAGRVMRLIPEDYVMAVCARCGDKRCPGAVSQPCTTPC